MTVKQQKQVKLMAEWLQQQVEQDSNSWLDENQVLSMFADVERKGGYFEKQNDREAVVYCKTRK